MDEIERTPVSLSERIRIQECYLDGLRKLRASLNMSIAEGGEVLKELLDEQARKDFEADLLSLEDEAAKQRMEAEGGIRNK